MLTDRQKDILAEYIKRTGTNSSDIRSMEEEAVVELIAGYCALRNEELDTDQACLDDARALYANSGE